MRSGALPSLKLTAKAPENRPNPQRKRESIPTIHFQGRLLLVLGRVLGGVSLRSLRNDGNSLEELSAEQDNLRDSLNELKQSCKRFFLCSKKTWVIF